METQRQRCAVTSSVTSASPVKTQPDRVFISSSKQCVGFSGRLTQVNILSSATDVNGQESGKNSSRHNCHHTSRVQLKAQAASLLPCVETPAVIAQLHLGTATITHKHTHKQLHLNTWGSSVFRVCVPVWQMCCFFAVGIYYHLPFIWGAWRCHLLFGQRMVLWEREREKKTTPDYKQCGNRNETNSPVAMATGSKMFFFCLLYLLQS